MTDTDRFEQIVREYYDRVDAEEYEELFDLFADDVTYERPGQETIEGMDEFRSFYLDERSLEDGDHDVEELLVDGRQVAVRGTFEGRQNGDAVSLGFADFHRFDRNGAITARWSYTDRDTV